MQTRDIVVIGGGPAGYIAAVQSARLGASVTLIEARELGGVCLNRGCIPTKTLVDTAKMLEHATDGKKRGIIASGTSQIDMKSALQFKARITKRMSMGIGVLLRDSGVEVHKGIGAVMPETATQKLVVNFTDHEPIHAKKIIVATGTNPLRFSIPGIDDPRVLTTDDLLNIDFVPPKLAILGAGVAGIEFARIFKAFGSDVHIIEAQDHTCSFLDLELSTAIEKSLASRKISLSLHSKLEKIAPHDAGLTLFLGDGSSIEASHLLLAVGRSPDVRAIESLHLQNNRGYITVNQFMQSSRPDVYVPGDLNGNCMLAHAAYRMGEIAAKHAVAQIQEKTIEMPEFTVERVPGAIFSDPELGCVGLSEEKAREKFGKILIGRFPLAANGRAVTAGHPEGFIKVIADAKTEKIVGVHAFGLCASELVNEAAVVVTRGLTIRQWTDVIHAHPTISEAMVEAAADAHLASLHITHSHQ